MSLKYVLVATLSAFVAICSIFTVNCEISHQVKRTNAAYNSPEGYAFHALRSCHRTLRGESGEFFSPDYLCSNPPLWCNWTIQVQPGRRLRLRLEDFTPADTCHLKQDQIHLDELPGSGRHRTLEQCWQDAVYLSDSSTLYVVLLIGGDLQPAYRGFHARYHAFGPPPPEPAPPRTPSPPSRGRHGHRGRETEETPRGDWHERPVMEQAAMDDDPASKSTTHPPPSLKKVSSAGSPLLQQPVKTTVDPKGLPARSAASGLRAGEGGALGVTRGVKATPELDSEEMWNDIVGSPSDSLAASESPAKGDPSKGKESLGHDRPVTASPPSPVEADLEPPLTGRHPNAWEATLENSWRERPDPVQYLRNTSRLAPLPGEHMFEVSVEVRVNPDVNENWDHMVRSLMSSVQTMIQGELKAHAAPKSISSIRIKRLSAGVLYIFWLQFDEGLDSLQVHRFMQMGLQRLNSQAVNTRGRKNPASIAFVSSEDVNECGTQLVLCDINAECINRFGSYACRCNPGFEDRSRLGTGGTICVGPSAPGHSSPSSPALLNFLSGLCFLLGFFVVLLLCVGRDSDSNNNDTATAAPAGATTGHNGSQLPPPPPIRRPRDGWGNPKDRCPSTDLPLLKFSPLAPPEDTICKEREEADKL
ncbi:hypothetical protein AAFF_G00050040 [Aldrovandia affinis]|uniref:EGF-like domain-containing protein n=1 Tax=Aldrovandia affinis TaxID=143900 RepID=A0AAD7WFM4_9TELE|nr:hypothetical protein AAFF_G00050040 [Aldrovandia affinis]